MTLPTLARAEGRIELVFGHRGDRSYARTIYQQGAAKVLLPRVPHGIEAVLINTAGGVTDGDRLSYDIALETGAEALVTTQAAEKVYRSRGGMGFVRTRLGLGAGAMLAWLPQETILFQDGRLDRRLEADLAPDARLLASESLVFGRTARGETVTRGALHDHWRIRQDGRLLWADRLHLDGDIQALLDRPAVLAGNRALATCLYVAADAARWLAPVRGWLDELPLRAGASLLPGLLAMRLIGQTGQAVRTALGQLLVRFRSALTGRETALPRVWTC